MESEAHGGGAMRAADKDAIAVPFAAGTASRWWPRHAGCDAVSHGVPGGSCDQANPRGPRAAGESGGAAGAIPQIPGAPHAPRPGGDAAHGAGVLSNRALQFSLTVPFASHEEADIARHFLTPRTQLRRPIWKELDVSRLTDEDHGLLQTAITFCLEQLSMVMRTL
ncbi:hypothetical protein FD755_023307 [Muntiacus reevesi]|uniref:Uncharacterized protein n=1 Tax=Muntiacus reevesi TaxID=9886 RepID=A0A5N3W0W3_MUNRE|nr:hypothetical protein FD755_023307 [Muntiacus reevesi]